MGDQNVPGQPPNTTPAGGSWQAAAPVIHDGKVIYTPPDSDLIYCLNLRDGKELWQAKRTEMPVHVYEARCTSWAGQVERFHR